LHISFPGWKKNIKIEREGGISGTRRFLSLIIMAEKTPFKEQEKKA